MLSGIVLSAHRYIFLNKHFYSACCIGLFSFCPILCGNTIIVFLLVITWMNCRKTIKISVPLVLSLDQILMNFALCIYLDRRIIFWLFKNKECRLISVDLFICNYFPFIGRGKELLCIGDLSCLIGLRRSSHGKNFSLRKNGELCNC